MNINSLNTLGTYRSQLERADASARSVQDAASAARTQTQPAAQAAGDRVSVSAAALLRTEAYKAAQNAPDIRQAKVNDIKERLDAGTYQVDSRNVAKKLLQSEVGLFRR